jgi:hypothetical protein
MFFARKLRIDESEYARGSVNVFVRRNTRYVTSEQSGMPDKEPRDTKSRDSLARTQCDVWDRHTIGTGIGNSDKL